MANRIIPCPISPVTCSDSSLLKRKVPGEFLGFSLPPFDILDGQAKRSGNGDSLNTKLEETHGPTLEEIRNLEVTPFLSISPFLRSTTCH